MKYIQLPGSAIQTTPLSFGCGGLYRTSSRAGRQRLLHAAFEAGIRHFDVAPLYGLGAAEAELGRFARGRRSKLVLATKFGLEPGKRLSWLVPFQGPARWTLNMVPSLRGIARRGISGREQPAAYSAERATASLERSLRALGTDYVDIFMLHEPILEQILYSDLYPLLERWREAGMIRTFGVAGYYPEVERISIALPALCRVVQMGHDAFSGQRLHLAAIPNQAVVTFGPFSSALPSLLALLREHPAACSEAARVAGLPSLSPDNVADRLLEESLLRNETGVVIYSSGKSDRIARLARLAEQPRERLLASARFLQILKDRFFAKAPP